MRQTTALMNGTDGIVIVNMPCAPMPTAEGDAPALVHAALVTSLTGSQPYYIKGGLIPHLTRKGYFWKSTPPAIRLPVLKYRLHIDPMNSASMELRWRLLTVVGHYLCQGSVTIMQQQGSPPVLVLTCALMDLHTTWAEQDDHVLPKQLLNPIDVGLHPCMKSYGRCRSYLP